MSTEKNGSKAGTPSPERLGSEVTFGDLTEGDRFYAFGDLWSKLSRNSARKHGKESISLGGLGYGYVGDPVCFFELHWIVKFVYPNT